MHLKHSHRNNVSLIFWTSLSFLKDGLVPKRSDVRDRICRPLAPSSLRIHVKIHERSARPISSVCFCTCADTRRSIFKKREPYEQIYSANRRQNSVDLFKAPYSFIDSGFFVHKTTVVLGANDIYTGYGLLTPSWAFFCPDWNVNSACDVRTPCCKSSFGCPTFTSSSISAISVPS